LKRLKEFGADQWGIFSRTIPGRVGYQCAAFYRKLVVAGEVPAPPGFWEKNAKLAARTGITDGEASNSNSSPSKSKGRPKKNKPKTIQFYEHDGDDDSDSDEDEMILEGEVDGEPEPKRKKTKIKVIQVQDQTGGIVPISLQSWGSERQNLQSNIYFWNLLDFCLFCGTRGDAADLLTCQGILYFSLLTILDCAETFHWFCMDPAVPVPAKFRGHWRCAHCKVCETCNDTGNEGQLLVCESCDRGFHTYCLQPALETVPEGAWLCTDCNIPPSGTPVQEPSSLHVKDFRRCTFCSFPEQEIHSPISDPSGKHATDGTESASVLYLGRLIAIDVDIWAHVLCVLANSDTSVGPDGALIGAPRLLFRYVKQVLSSFSNSIF
jgi:hypothetical protein